MNGGKNVGWNGDGTREQQLANGVHLQSTNGDSIDYTFTGHEDFHNFLILSHVPKHDQAILSPSDWPMFGCREASSDWRTKTKGILMLEMFLFFLVVFFFYLFCALIGGVTQIFSSTLFGPMDTGVLGFVAPFPDKQAVFNGEQDLRFVLRHDRLRNKSLLRMSTRPIEKRKQIQCRAQRNLTQRQTTNLDFSGFSSFNRIWDNSPTKSSSTLWLMPTDVSMNLQSYAVAIAFPSKHRKKMRPE